MADDKRISELPPATTPLAGTEEQEIIQGGVNKRVAVSEVGGGSVTSVTGDGVDNTDPANPVVSGVTREFDRAHSTELLFDKNEIAYVEHTLTGDITFTVADTGNLTNQFSSIIQEIITDGTRVVNFSGFKYVTGNIQSGSIPEAGTYPVTFLYYNGIAWANWGQPSSEASNLVPLAAPTNFVAVVGTDPDTEIDLSWTAVPNVSSYEIQYSSTGGAGPWIALTNPVAAATTYTHTGLTANTTYHYRIRAIGDQVTYSSSVYSVAATTTEDAGDVTPPTMEHSIAAGATGIPVNEVLILTFSEPIRKLDNSEITNANAGDVIAVKQTNGAGAVIPCTFVVNAEKTEIQVIPNVIYGDTQLVFVEATGIEDVNNNAMVTDNFTFTTSDYTLANGNYLAFDGAVNTAITNILCVDDANFDIEWTQNELNISLGASLLVSKYESGKRSILVNSIFPDLSFKFYSNTGSDATLKTREIVWEDSPLTTTEQNIRIEYRGAVDTNDGLDRLSLYIDDVLEGSKTLISPEPGVGWPFFIRAETALFRFGPARAQVKNLKITSNNGTVTELDIPIMRTGLDVSGNNRHGSWV